METKFKSTSLSHSELTFLLNIDGTRIEDYEDKYDEVRPFEKLVSDYVKKHFYSLPFLKAAEDEYGTHGFEILEDFDSEEFEGLALFGVSFRKGRFNQEAIAALKTFVEEAAQAAAGAEHSITLKRTLLYREYTARRYDELGPEADLSKALPYEAV